MHSFFCSLCGQVPKQEKPRMTLLPSNSTTKARWIPNLSPRISADAKDFVQQMLLADPEQRPSARQLLDHAWFKVSHLCHISTLTQALIIFFISRLMVLNLSSRPCPLP
jgi:serine/threonine protein kinase